MTANETSRTPCRSSATAPSRFRASSSASCAKCTRRFSPERQRELAARVESIPKPYGIPVIDKPPEDLRYLAYDRTWTNEAREIRIEQMPAGGLQGTIERWPAEDLVPLAELTTRTFTRDEWNAIAARLEYHDRRGFADFRMLPGNVMLRVIVTE